MSSESVGERSAGLDAWKSEISELIYFVKEYATLIGAAIATASGISVFSYIRAESLPINLASSAFLTSLPAVSVAVTFLIAICICCSLLPTVVMFLPVAPGRSTHMSKVFSGSSELRRRAKVQMFFSLCSPALLICFVLLAFAYIDPPKDDPSLHFAVILVLILSWLIFIRLIGGRKWVGLRSSYEFYFLTLSAVLVQLIVLIAILQISLREFLDEDSGILSIALASIPTALVAVMIQIVAAVSVSYLVRTRKPVRNIALTVFLVVLSVCIIPTSGSFIAGRVMQIMASGGRGCIVLELVRNEASYNSPSLESKGGGKSVPVQLMAESDGSYFARPTQGGVARIFKIKTDTVSGFEACPNKEGGTPGK